jgi:hypothetical protein
MVYNKKVLRKELRKLRFLSNISLPFPWEDSDMGKRHDDESTLDWLEDGQEYARLYSNLDDDDDDDFDDLDEDDDDLDDDDDEDDEDDDDFFDDDDDDDDLIFDDDR